LLDHGAIDYVPKDAFSTKVLLETLRQLGVLEEAGVSEGGGADERA
jgi:hypothetical protein